MIKYISIFILVISLFQFLISLTNWLFRVRLNKPNEFKKDKKISILIPARNEEKNIGNILEDLISSNSVVMEILIFDDESSDKTANIVKENSLKDSRIKLLESKGLENGWMGKNFACHNLSVMAKGDYLLFIDSDVRISNNIIEKALKYAISNKLELLSIFPNQIMITKGEKISIPNMNFILLSLLALPLVLYSKFSSISAANGQFMLFKTDTYRNLQPHKLFKTSKAEDIQISRFYKKNKLRIACLASLKDISCRMYSSLEESIQGFSKNINYFFGNSYLIALLFWLLTSFGFIPFIINGDLLLLFVYIFIILITRILISLTSNQSVKDNLKYIVHQQYTLGRIIFKSFHNKRNRELTWKGRTI
jgi:glycosyltransferase involved in cell wall biosynthesis